MSIATAALLAAAPAHAQVSRNGQAGPQQLNKMPEAPAKLPKGENRRTRGLDFLFGALKVAPDVESAKAVEARIWAIWNQPRVTPRCC